MSRRALAASVAGVLAAAALPALATITLTAEATYPAVMEKDDRITGHAAEKVHEIMRRAGLAYSMSLMPWKRAYTLAQTRPATCVFMTTHMPERAAQFHWIGPISHTDWVLYGRADRRYNIRTLDDAQGLNIGAYHGDVRGEYLAAKGLKVDFTQNDESNPKKLMLDRVDLWVNSTRSSRPMIAQLGLTGKIVPVLTFYQAKLHLACNLSMPGDAVARMQAAFAAMEADGSYKAIEQRFEHLQKP